MNLKYFDLSRNDLKVQGSTLWQWSKKVGSTPFYIFDRQIIAQKIAEVRACISPDIHLHYAVKANPMSQLVQYMAQNVDGFDVASSGELRLALSAGMSPAKIGFAGPGKSDVELQMALEAGVLLSVESMNELERISALSRASKLNPRVALRINPQFEMKSAGMKMGGGPKQFGIDSESIPEVLRELKKMGIPLEGLHIFTGSQTLNADILCENQKHCFDLLLSLKALFNEPLQSFNFGGGFGIPYFEGDESLDLQKVKQNLQKLTAQMKNQFPQLQGILELGRFLVGESGIFVSRIVDVKVSRGQTFLILDGGMNNHLAASGNLGQTIKRPFPMAVIQGQEKSEFESVTVVGPLCTPLDQFAQQVNLRRAEVGDLVAIFQSGAYGLSASPYDFLSHKKPQEIFP